MKENLILKAFIIYSVIYLSGCKKDSLKISAEPSSGERTVATHAAGNEMRGLIPSGSYRIITYTSGGQAIGVAAASRHAGAKIEQRDYKFNTGQEWIAQNLGNNEYIIVNTNSGMALQVPANYTPGVQIQQNTRNVNMAAQRWVGKYLGNGIYQIRSKLNLNLGLNIDADGALNGAKVTLNTLTTSRSHFMLYRTVYKDVIATDFFKRTTGWTAGDGALSVALDDGRTLWNFGDCHQNDYSNGTVACFFNVNSIAMVQPANKWTPSATTTLLGPPVDGRRTLYRGSLAKEHFNWPICGIQLGDTVYTFTDMFHYTHIPANTTQMVHDKPQWAKLKVSAITNQPTYTDLPAGLNSSTNGGIEFGFGFVKAGDGYVYVYGRKRIFIHAEVYLARFLQSAPNGAWQFYRQSTNTWVSNVSQAQAIGEAPSNSLHVSKVNNKYLLLSSEFALACNAGKKIYAATSNNITGPFPAYNSPAHKVIYEVDERLNGNSPIFYLPIAHPQFTVNDNLLICYSIGGYNPCSPDCSGNRKNPDYYRPAGVRVPLKLIDPAF